MGTRTRGDIIRSTVLVALLACAACDGNGGIGGVALQGESVTAGTGDVVQMCIDLSTGGQAIAATQNDLRWDSNCLSLVDRCVVNPAIGKELLSNQRAGNELRAIVISLSDTNPIPAGQLYCCSMRVSAASGCCAVEIFATSASDPEGQAVALGTSDGEICVE